MPNLPDHLAGNSSLGSWEPVQLFAGEGPIITDGGTVGVAFTKYQVIAIRSADGLLVPFDPTAEDTGAEIAIGIANEAGVVGATAPYYRAGVFNHEALTWPASLTTLAQRKAAFERSQVVIKALY